MTIEPIVGSRVRPQPSALDARWQNYGDGTVISLDHGGADFPVAVVWWETGQVERWLAGDLDVVPPQYGRFAVPGGWEPFMPGSESFDRNMGEGAVVEFVTHGRTDGRSTETWARLIEIPMMQNSEGTWVAER